MSGGSASNLLAEKMLAGWTLLATNCPEPSCCTPLVSSRKDMTRLLCVKCDKWYSTEQPAVVIESAPTSKASQESTPVPTANQTPQDDEATAYAARKKRRDATSSKLGEKMLQGWTLMGSVCPISDCGTPFVRHRETGQLFCVTCDRYAIAEDQATEQVVPAAPESVARSFEPPCLPAHAPAAPASSQQVVPPSSVDWTADSTTSLALDVLYRKLAAATAALEASTSDKDVSAQSRVLADLAKAIKALHTIHSFE
ncbi:hypothetical protein, variant 2 [Aphanomyces invadans]|uniref:Uncharacterized protein n=2 Tax=Aphanomyces invadans TaxID=157072 RepID=A0A024TJ09_9STRA|nr:hypothetical protein, variant 2 [Aphanomyces invadans]ETV94038.1 hypothetical protein, variant 2 [Aphanomyces invadans]|eukprot:XP_008877242.1 hypothetical protein, variant 2 [Aphanomyces invadans]